MSLQQQQRPAIEAHNEGVANAALDDEGLDDGNGSMPRAVEQRLVAVLVMLGPLPLLRFSD